LSSVSRVPLLFTVGTTMEMEGRSDIFNLGLQRRISAFTLLKI